MIKIPDSIVSTLIIGWHFGFFSHSSYLLLQVPPIQQEHLTSGPWSSFLPFSCLIFMGFLPHLKSNAFLGTLCKPTWIVEKWKELSQFLFLLFTTIWNNISFILVTSCGNPNQSTLDIQGQLAICMWKRQWHNSYTVCNAQVYLSITQYWCHYLATSLFCLSWYTEVFLCATALQGGYFEELFCPMAPC